MNKIMNKRKTLKELEEENNNPIKWDTITLAFIVGAVFYFVIRFIVK